MRFRTSWAVFVLLASLPAGACGLLRKPDMSRRTGIARLSRPQRPLILIPGFIGTKLRDPVSHKVAWGTMPNVLMGGDSDDLALPIGGEKEPVPGESLVPYQIYDSLWGVDYYSKIIRSLKDAGGYQVGDIENPKPGDTAFVFIYDWRRDNVESARRLGEAIDHLRKARGIPDERYDLLTHSQGGLIARYYVKYGGADVLAAEETPAPTMAGAASVGKLIMLGTPNRGCLESLKVLHVGLKKIFRPMRPEVVFTMPALYEMLPPRGSVLFADLQGRPLDLDLYDAGTWERQGWSVFSEEAQARIRKRLGRGGGPASDLEEHNGRLRDFLARSLRRAQLFHQALDAPDPPGAQVAYYAFGSDCISTLKTAIVTQEDGKQVISFDKERFRDKESPDRLAAILYGPGDGTVLMQSLLAIPDGGERKEAGSLSFNSAFFVCENHGVLPNDPIFQNNLFYLLLWAGEPDTPLAAARTSAR